MDLYLYNPTLLVVSLIPFPTELSKCNSSGDVQYNRVKKKLPSLSCPSSEVLVHSEIKHPSDNITSPTLYYKRYLSGSWLLHMIRKRPIFTPLSLTPQTHRSPTSRMKSGWPHRWLKFLQAGSSNMGLSSSHGSEKHSLHTSKQTWNIAKLLPSSSWESLIWLDSLNLISHHLNSPNALITVGTEVCGLHGKTTVQRLPVPKGHRNRG